jgi:hypothetical protein
MQEAEEPTRGGNEASARAMSPIAAFVILLAVVAAVFGVWLLTREDEPTRTQPDRGPGFALTNEEAIERFKELDAMRLRAYRQRDLSLLSQIFVPDSAIARRVSHEIRRLIRVDVLDRPALRTERLEVISNTPTEIVVQQTVVEKSRFLHESGEDVTVDPAHQRLVIDWHLALVDSRWLIQSAFIVKTQDLPDE